LLYPICAYFLAFSSLSRAASRQYLAKVLERDVRLRDVFRHYHVFASCALDRVFLLNDRTQLFDLVVHGEDVVVDQLKQGAGCFLFGAHFGSFEVVRSIGRQHRQVEVSLVMYEANARKIGAVLNAINPHLALDVIGLGRANSMIEVEERVARGHFVGILADRGLEQERRVRRDFLGAPAYFPEGPFRMISMLNHPVILMFGVYGGGQRYDVFFERLWSASGNRTEAPAESADAVLSHYVRRLEHYCRLAPYNWFNFYDFWR
jgi:predicted LPLAT superfamily acyltransferase